MRWLTLLSMQLVLVGVCSAKSPVGDWQSVQQDIPKGWQITVVTSFAFPCIFLEASSTELLCQTPRQRWADFPQPESHILRERIREIRVERRQGTNMLAGVALGAVAGAGFGALAAPAARGASAYVFGVIGALTGGHRGGNVHILRGKIIYRVASSRRGN